MLLKLDPGGRLPCVWWWRADHTTQGDRGQAGAGGFRRIDQSNRGGVAMVVATTMNTAAA